MSVVREVWLVDLVLVAGGQLTSAQARERLMREDMCCPQRPAACWCCTRAAAAVKASVPCCLCAAVPMLLCGFTWLSCAHDPFPPSTSAAPSVKFHQKIITEILLPSEDI